ncbi:MAG: glycoside hydrolase [Lentimicrobium sp.]
MSFGYCQNLITNPGFENGMNGWDFWIRDEGAGIAEIVTSPVHVGNQAVKISHWGPNDWSFRPDNDFMVSPGEIYEFSAWVSAGQITDYAGMSFALFDDSGNSVNWAYNETEINIHESYFQYSIRMVVPEDVARVLPRFTGIDSCSIYIDDVSFELIGQVAENQVHHFENFLLDIELFTPSFRINVIDKIAGVTHIIQSTVGYNIQSIDSSENSFTFYGNYIESNSPIVINISLVNNELKFSLLEDPEQPLIEEIAFPGPIESKAGDFLIVPWASGMILPVEEGFPFWQFGLYDWKATMAFAGVTNLSSGYMISTYDPWDTRIEFPEGSNGLTSIKLINEPSKHTLGYQRRFSYVFFPAGGYVSMAQWYRNFAMLNGYVKTFAQKTAENPNVEKLRGAVDFWALDWHFLQPEFIDSLHRFGIDRAIISLTGSWNEVTDFSAVIDTINNLGYLSSRYDIFTDVWPPLSPPIPGYRTDGFPGDVVVQEDGSLLEGWLALLEDGTTYQGYYTCSATHADYARDRIQEELTDNHYNCRFIDVELSSTLVECYSNDHPATRESDGLNRKALLDVVKNEFSLVTGSEEARDFAFPMVDFGEGTMSIMPADSAGYDWTTPTDDPGELFLEYNMNAARRIPLHGLVYHDVHVPSWYTGDGLSKVPAYWDKKVLFNVLYASMPLIAPPDYAYWQMNRERFLTSMMVTSAVFRSCGFAQMTDHLYLTEDKMVQKTVFDNGWSVAANAGTTSFQLGNLIIPPDGFVAGNNEGSFAYRIIAGSGIISMTKHNDRFFFNPGGQAIPTMGFISTGSISGIKHPTSLNLSFIGNQPYIDLNPSLMPWPMQNIVVTDLHNGQAADLSNLGNGFYRLHKTGDHLFYRINGDFLAVSDPDLSVTEFKVSPNPTRKKFTTEFTLKNPAKVWMRLLSVQGAVIRLLCDQNVPSGKNTFSFETECAPGLYFIEFEANGIKCIRKLIVSE